MGSRFVPITFGLIEEGRFLESVDEALRDAAAKLIEHGKKYGPELTAKAKAELTVKITIQNDGAEDGIYSVKGAIATKLPGRPIHLTRAIHETEQDGQESLFVRASGSTADTPRQGKLSTEDGKPIDLNTGEVKKPPKPDRRSSASGE